MSMEKINLLMEIMVVLRPNITMREFSQIIKETENKLLSEGK